MLIIPAEQLEADTLAAVLEEFITREGTDYGATEWSLDQKREQLLRQIRAGKACLCYDPVSQSCTVMLAEQAQQWVEQS